MQESGKAFAARPSFAMILASLIANSRRSLSTREICMIRYQLTLAAIVAGLCLADGQQAVAQTSGNSGVTRARMYNPFTVLRYSRLTANRFGLPTRSASAPLSIFDAPIAPTELTSAVVAPAPVTQSPLAAAVSGSESTAGGGASGGSGSAVRPPFRPRVRSPFRPPPRPPF